MPRNSEFLSSNEEQPLEQLVVHVMSEARKAVMESRADDEYLQIVNDLLNAILDGKRITASAHPDAPIRVFGYQDEAFRWVLPDDVSEISGVFKNADVKLGRINLYRDEDETLIPERIHNYDWWGGPLHWDVALINTANKEEVEIVSDIKFIEPLD